jgi:hypothetical protein
LRNLNQHYLTGNGFKDFKQIESFQDKNHIPKNGLKLIRIQDLQAGIANIIFEDGSTYCGGWLNFERDNKGVYRKLNGDFWDGRWKADQKDGFFKYKGPKNEMSKFAIFSKDVLKIDNLIAESSMLNID